MKIKIPLATPPWSKLGKSLESACRKALYTFSMIDGSPLAIALSGGKDSLSLLYLLHAINGKGFPKVSLHAIHVSGKYTCGAGIEKNFLQAICNTLEIPLHIRTQENTDISSLECYSCSRERRKILFLTAKQLNCKTIAFGHHRDDSIQTFLMNMLHKAEFAANLAKIYMHQYDMTIVRPLIYIEERAIRAFAQGYGFLKATCQCPVGQDSIRKKTDKILQEIEKIFPNARSNLAKISIEHGLQKAARP